MRNQKVVEFTFQLHYVAFKKRRMLSHGSMQQKKIAIEFSRWREILFCQKEETSLI